MNPPGPAANADLLLRRLMENNDESATAALFLQLYRQSPELRHWLREDYGRDAKLRKKVDGLAMKGASPQVARFAELTDDNGPWRKERRRLKKEISGHIYGGLTWNEVVQLIHRYQAAHLDPGAFLLVRQWREAGKVTPALIWAGLAFLESVLPSGKRRLLKHLNQAPRGGRLRRLVETEHAILHPPASPRILQYPGPARSSRNPWPGSRHQGCAPILQAAWYPPGRTRWAPPN
jgi:hypothetical protein